MDPRHRGYLRPAPPASERLAAELLAERARREKIRRVTAPIVGIPCLIGCILPILALVLLMLFWAGEAVVKALVGS